MEAYPLVVAGCQVIGSIVMYPILLDVCFCQHILHNHQIIPITIAQLQGGIAQYTDAAYEILNEECIHLLNLINDPLAQFLVSPTDKADKRKGSVEKQFLVAVESYAVYPLTAFL